MERCHVCGRLEVDKALRIRGRLLCSVCERITVQLRPQHPLYPFWVKAMAGLPGEWGA